MTNTKQDIYKGHVYVPQRVLNERDIDSGLKMLAEDSKEANLKKSNSYILLKRHHKRENFVVYDLVAKGDWNEWVHNLIDVVSNPMNFISMLIKIRQLKLAIYYDITDAHKHTDTGVFVVAGNSINDFRLSTAEATAVDLGQI